MSLVLDHDGTPLAPAPAAATSTTRSARAAWVIGAGLASLGAGAIHAAAIGVHAEHRPAALTFTVVAALQLGVGGLALVRPTRAVAVVAGVINLALFGGWLLAKTKGISFIEGLEVAEPAQAADTIAAGLALASAAAAGVALRASTAPAENATLPLTIGAVAVTIVTLVGMVGAGTHVHEHGSHVEAGTTGSADHDMAGMDHAHTAAPASTTPGSPAAPAGDHDMAGMDHSHASPAVAPVPYDPSKPIDLGGVPGVTPAQQAFAENLVAVTLVRLPQWSDPAVAEAAGFHSIGDGLTGVEHFLNEAYIADDIQLDPDKPESLVYDTTSGQRRLVAAMYMAPIGTTLETVDNRGGGLMQWHIHDNLCFFPNNVLGGLTDRKGNCAPGLTKGQEIPMVHVWIEPHRCGPFAALEGIGGGTIEQGEQRLCDHAHGS